jgi:hypothetical protein
MLRSKRLQGLGPVGCLLLAACAGAPALDGAGGGSPHPAAASTRHEDALRAAFPRESARAVDVGLALAASDGGFRATADADAPLRVRLPRAGDDAIVLALPDGAVVRVREVGARGDGELAGRAVAYARAGGSVYWTVAPTAAEEWLRFEPGALREGEPAASWSVDGAALRQDGDGVEVALDGAPRLRVTATEAFAASGRALRPRLAVRDATIELWVEDARGEAVLVDPQWTATGNGMTAARGWFTLTALKSGKVLAAGGTNSPTTQAGAYEASANLFDPSTSLWVNLSPLTSFRYRHAATLLTNGKVLLAGGFFAADLNGQLTYYYLSSAEVFDPATSSFAPTGGMANNRSYPTLTTLADGRVLAVGGYNGAQYTATAELWDPGTGAWTSAGQLGAARRFHTATLLPNGYGGGALSSVALYDPASNTWAAQQSLAVARAHHTATLLPNGKVFLVGGSQETEQNPGAAAIAATEIYDPATQQITGGPTMPTPLTYHTATLLPGGRVLVAGGRTGGGNATQLALVYDANTSSWSTTSPLIMARQHHEAAALADGRVLVAGGSQVEGGAYLGTTEVWSGGSANGVACGQNADCQSGYCVDGVCCNTACNQGTCDACSVAAGAQVDGSCFGFSGKACNDGSACTTVDSCQAGVCVGGAPVKCPLGDACHFDGACNPQTGQCSLPPKPNGTACDDGNGCTSGDACLNGSCAAGQPVVCQALDACHKAGSCDPKVGACTNPAAPDGTACNDGSLCTQGETCQAGQCKGGSGVACQAIDACHAAGVCDPGTGQCTNPPAPDGTACDDGNPCTTSDACSQGGCVGATPVACPAPDGCHTAGTCDPGQGGCVYPSAPDGTACDDGSKCTAVDTCVAGACQGTAKVTCKALDGCHDAGECVDATGVCTNPAKADGTPCADGVCTAGKCGPAPVGGGGGGQTGTGGGANGAGGGAATSTDKKAPLELSDSDGCGCRAAGSEPAGDARWLAVAALALVGARRRERRA